MKNLWRYQLLFIPLTSHVQYKCVRLHEMLRWLLFQCHCCHLCQQWQQCETSLKKHLVAAPMYTNYKLFFSFVLWAKGEVTQRHLRLNALNMTLKCIHTRTWVFIHSSNHYPFLCMFRVSSTYLNMHSEEGGNTTWAHHQENMQINRETFEVNY